MVECVANKVTLGKAFKKDSKVIGEYLAGLSEGDCDRIEKELSANG